MNSGTEQSCPRCGQAFVCKAEQIDACGCFGISFTSDQQAALSHRYTGCLCRACLLHLQQQPPVLPEAWGRGL